MQHEPNNAQQSPAHKDGAAAREEFAGRLFEASIAALDLCHVYLGDRLGLYRMLAERGPLNSRELAEAGGVAERYAREWLEQQDVAGIVEPHRGRELFASHPPLPRRGARSGDRPAR
ncbi:MAG: hypothetical protein ABR592_14030 [Nitriliruptorales bacterium]